MWLKSCQLTPDYNQTTPLDDGRLGYRKIAQHLNVKCFKIAKGNDWKNTQVYSVLKRYEEKMFRQQITTTKYEPVWSKMILSYE